MIRLTSPWLTHPMLIGATCRGEEAFDKEICSSMRSASPGNDSAIHPAGDGGNLPCTTEKIPKPEISIS